MSLDSQGCFSGVFAFKVNSLKFILPKQRPNPKTKYKKQKLHCNRNKGYFKDHHHLYAPIAFCSLAHLCHCYHFIPFNLQRFGAPGVRTRETNKHLRNTIVEKVPANWWVKNHAIISHTQNARESCMHLEI